MKKTAPLSPLQLVIAPGPEQAQLPQPPTWCLPVRSPCLQPALSTTTMIFLAFLTCTSKIVWTQPLYSLQLRHYFLRVPDMSAKKLLLWNYCISFLLFFLNGLALRKLRQQLLHAGNKPITRCSHIIIISIARLHVGFISYYRPAPGPSHRGGRCFNQEKEK